MHTVFNFSAAAAFVAVLVLFTTAGGGSAMAQSADQTVQYPQSVAKVTLTGPNGKPKNCTEAYQQGYSYCFDTTSGNANACQAAHREHFSSCISSGVYQSQMYYYWGLERR